MSLSLGFSSRGVWVRCFMESCFPFVPHPVTRSLHICLLFPFQSYLVGVGPCGSLSHPPPTGRRMSLPCPPMLLGECNACIRGPSVHIDFSLSEFPPGVELQTICLDLLWLGTFAVEASDLSTWRPSVDASAESAGVRGWFPFRLTVWSPCCIRDSQESSQAPQFKSSILWHSPFLMVQIAHLYMITGKIITLTLQISVTKWVSAFWYTVQVFHSLSSFQGASVF